MEKITSNEQNNFSNFLKNQKLKDNLSNLNFDEIIKILTNIENVKKIISDLKEKNFQILNKNKSLSKKTDSSNLEKLNQSKGLDDIECFNQVNLGEQLNHKKIKENDLNENSIRTDFIENDEKKEISISKFEDIDFETINKMIEEDFKNEEFSNNINHKTENIHDIYSSNANLITKKTKILNNLINDLKESLFNVNGILISTKAKVNDHDKNIDKYKLSGLIRFDFHLVVKDMMYRNNYDIFFFNLKPELAKLIDNLKANTEIFILNLKAGLCLKTGALKLFQTLSSKIFVKMPFYHDSCNPIFLEDGKKFMISENNNDNCNSKNKLSKDNENFGRKYIPGKGFFINKFSGNLIDITKNDELEFLDLIDSNSIDEILRKIPNEIKDISQFLFKEVDNTIYTVTNALSINRDIKSISVCGIITSVKVEEKLTTLELLSLKDSNFIKVLHFMKNFSIEFKENMILILTNVNQKINKNFDIFLEIISEKSVNVLGILTNEEIAKFKKFRFDKNKEYDCILQLISNKLVRRIQKVIYFSYLIKFKSI